MVTPLFAPYLDVPGVLLAEYAPLLIWNFRMRLAKPVLLAFCIFPRYLAEPESLAATKKVWAVQPPEWVKTIPAPAPPPPRRVPAVGAPPVTGPATPGSDDDIAQRVARASHLRHPETAAMPPGPHWNMTAP